MGWLEALVLGIVQGLTEFLPISSSAHQSIIGQFFGGEDLGAAFTAITQLGTETAVIIFFRRDIWLIIKHWALALVGQAARGRPGGADGLAGDPRLDPDRGAGGALPGRDRLSAAQPVDHNAAMLTGFGVLIGIVDRLARNARPLESLTWQHGVLFGLAQSLALIPACPGRARRSRPAWPWATKRVAAAKYAFLLAIPAVVGSGFFKLADIADDRVEPAWGRSPWRPSSRS